MSTVSWRAEILTWASLTQNRPCLVYHSMVPRHIFRWPPWLWVEPSFILSQLYFFISGFNRDSQNVGVLYHGCCRFLWVQICNRRRVLETSEPYSVASVELAFIFIYLFSGACACPSSHSVLVRRLLDENIWSLHSTWQRLHSTICNSHDHCACLSWETKIMRQMEWNCCLRLSWDLVDINFTPVWIFIIFLESNMICYVILCVYVYVYRDIWNDVRSSEC